MTTMGAASLNGKIIEREELEKVNLKNCNTFSNIFHLGAMVPFTLRKPPETTMAIALVGVELIRIMAKESEICLGTWQWQC